MNREWLYNQDIVGPVIAFTLTVGLVQWILPLFVKKKKLAREKLKNFYNVAHAFVTIREGFSKDINGKIHDKNNCGLFHDFTIDGQNLGTIVYLEQAFFNYALQGFDYMEKDLKKVFIKYLKARGPDFVRSNDGCANLELIRLRKLVEQKIEMGYAKYDKLVD